LRVDVFVAVAEPTRRAMLDLLAGGERAAGDLVAAFPGLTQPAISRHLRVLRDVGLVDARPDGQRRIYALRPERLAELDAWLSRYRGFWSGQLDALDAHLSTRKDS
jgi:DNA-binding transcriptional ArsR family regulator